MDDRPIFLVGFMGSGKSSLGRRLAERLGFSFHDTDERVERREGREIAPIFREEGEAYFRDVEFEVLRGLDGRRGAVVATGGGLFLGAAQRRWMKRRGRTVWLDVPLDVCAARVGEGAARPLWHPEDPIAFRALFDRRSAAYALAELRLRAGAESADELVGRLLGVFG